ncbi:MAG: DUF1800 domain-containing protein, partial [Rhodobacteraceae bacterium]|nr:DUF1800 domain-containing protein [Paracoccaceae bacterium]
SVTSPIRIALNRVTFGARDIDVAKAESMGWENWVEDQLNPPAGDDPALAGLLNGATLKIAYSARDTETQSWPAVNEERPLTTLSMNSADLLAIYDKVRAGELPNAEINRLGEETVAATWIRNAHSAYQVREVMADFWHRHFNVAASEGQQVIFTLPIYDRDVIRANIFGNFRAFVTANAQSTAMLFYLDNADSRASQPNENYARELLELHTIGASGYVGVNKPPWTGPGPEPVGTQSVGFSDQDVIAASRALSGWTVGMGQRAPGRRVLPKTGEFLYEAAFHNPDAGEFMGVHLPPSPAADLNSTQAVEQGLKVIELAAEHDITGRFVVTKLATRLFGDTPPQNVIDVATATWLANRKSSTQLRDTLRTILLSPELMQAPAVKVRRPYEKMIAIARGVGAAISPKRSMLSVFNGTKDAIFTWPAPNGWPDKSGYWLATSGLLTQWNAVLNSLNNGLLSVSLANESIDTTSIVELVDDWTERIVGGPISASGRQALIDFASNSSGIKGYVGLNNANAQNIENQLRRLVTMIAASPEFSYR